jgi:hypothetical protein
MFPDDYFADLYTESARGRPTVPARVMATVMLLCFGPARGRMVTYTSPHRWLPRRGPAPGTAVPGRSRRPSADPGGPGRNYPVLLVDGAAGGVWHQRRFSSKLAAPFCPTRKNSAPRMQQDRTCLNSFPHLRRAQQ